MLRKLRQVVLLLMMAMAVLSPFMQLDSWDNFPTSTDDIELQIIFGLCIVGMILVFVGIMQLVPILLRSDFLAPTVEFHCAGVTFAGTQSALSAFSLPLRN